MGLSASTDADGFLPPVIEECGNDENSKSRKDEAVQLWLERVDETRRTRLEIDSGDLDWDLDLSDTALSGTVLEVLAERMPVERVNSLAWLDLSYNPHIARFATSRIFPSLEFVTLTHCIDLCDQALAAVAGCCPSLVSLDLSACTLITDRGVAAVAEARRAALTQLNLHRCSRITDAGVTTLARLCPSIQLLCLGHCRMLTDTAVCAIASSCSRLRWFDVMECGQLGDESVISLASNCRALETLVLAGNSRITDHAVHALATYLHNLVSLNLSFCNQVSGRAVTEVTNNAPHLRELMLAGCAAMKSDDILMMVTAGDALDSRLQNLVLSGCLHLTDDDLGAILTACPWLVSISAIGCDRLTQSGMSRLQAANPEIQINV